MQFPNDTDLAAALAPGQVRRMGVLLKFDWGRDGTFSNTYSDMSENVDDWVIDRQLTGSYPAQLEVVEGYAGGMLTITLHGNAADAQQTAIWRLFSPYAGFFLGNLGYVGVAVQLSTTVATASGTRTIRQFTGIVQSALPSRGNSNVTITCLDGAGMLQAPTTLPPYASDQIGQTLSGINYPATGTSDPYFNYQMQASWVIERVLRTAGFYQGPPWPVNTLLAWTLTGSGLPDVGEIDSEDYLINGDWDNGYGQYTSPNETPGSIDGTGVWTPGQYGPAYVGSAQLQYPPNVGGVIPPFGQITDIHGGAHTRSLISVNQFGANNSNLLIFGGWYYRDPAALSTDNMNLLFILEEARFDYHYNSGNQWPAHAQVNVNPLTGIVEASVQPNFFWGTTWQWNSTTAIPANQWTYVYFVFQFTSTSILGYCRNGTTGADLMTPGTNGGVANWIQGLPYTFTTTQTHLGGVFTNGRMQYASISYQPDTPIGSLVPPPTTPTGVGTKLDMSACRLSWLPESAYQVPGWDIIKAVAEAEFGVVLFDEFNVPIFNTRATIKGLMAAPTQFTITLDSAQDITPVTTIDSVINSISIPYTRKQSVPYSVAYAEPNAATYATADGGTVNTYPLAMTGVQSIRVGNISWRPQAQGYGFASGSPQYLYDAGGQGPSGTFTYKDWMTAYGPDYWADGFTAHAPTGATTPVQPLQDTGLNVIMERWWSNNPTFYGIQQIRLVMYNTNSTHTLQASVDDNTAFLNAQGTTIVTVETGVVQANDANSQLAYGVRALQVPQSDYQQDPLTLQPIANSLLADLKQPTPYMSAIPILGDPRIQLRDMGAVSDTQGMGTMVGMTVGIHREFSIQNGMTDSLTLRLVPGGYAWTLDDPNLSILDGTTWLA